MVYLEAGHGEDEDPEELVQGHVSLLRRRVHVRVRKNYQPALQQQEEEEREQQQQEQEQEQDEQEDQQQQQEEEQEKGRRGHNRGSGRQA